MTSTANMIFRLSESRKGINPAANAFSKPMKLESQRIPGVKISIVIGTGQKGIWTFAETARSTEPAKARTNLNQIDSSILGKTVVAILGYMIRSKKVSFVCRK